jgi:hypothetical protein
MLAEKASQYLWPLSCADCNIHELYKWLQLVSREWMISPQSLLAQNVTSHYAINSEMYRKSLEMARELISKYSAFVIGE